MVNRIKRGMLSAVGLATVAIAAISIAHHDWVTPRAEAQAASADYETGRYVFADLADNVLPSIVTIYVKHDFHQGLDEETMQQFEQFRRMFPQLEMPDPEDLPPATGSGIIISEDGYILTNGHVVGQMGDENEITVVLADDTELSGDDIKLIESNRLTDLALIKVNKTGLTPIKWGDSTALRIGERVAAIGSPLDLRQTVTQGIVCAKQREVGDVTLGGQLIDMIQTDAVINPGSSGGALVNLDGELVGINRLITTNNQRWQGFGFAIPSDDAKEFADTVMREGEYASGYIGIVMRPEALVTESVLRSFKIDEDLKGVMVEGIAPSTEDFKAPAYEAGIQVGDYITEVDGRRVESPLELLKVVARQPIGSKLKVKLIRLEKGDSKEKTFTLTVTKRPSEEVLSAQMNNQPVPAETPKEEKTSDDHFGMQLEEFNDDGLRGLLVRNVQPNSKAQEAGLESGDIIIKANGYEIEEINDLDQSIKSLGDDNPLSVVFVRDGRERLTMIEGGEE